MKTIFKSTIIILLAFTTQLHAIEPKPKPIWSNLEKTKLSYKAELFDISVPEFANEFYVHEGTKKDLYNYNEEKMLKHQGSLIPLIILTSKQVALFKKKYANKEVIKNVKEQLQNRIAYNVSGLDEPNAHEFQIQSFAKRRVSSILGVYENHSIVLAYRDQNKNSKFQILIFTFEKNKKAKKS